MRSAKAFTFLLLICLFCVGCSQEILSERDISREQARTRADIKRSELSTVAGDYDGELLRSGISVLSALKLEAKDIPTAVEGQVDPVLIPTLTGYLHLIVGSAEHERYNYSITRSDYDFSNKTLTFVASNNQYKDMFFSFAVVDGRLEGTWNAPEAGISGTVTFTKKGGTKNE